MRLSRRNCFGGFIRELSSGPSPTGTIHQAVSQVRSFNGSAACPHVVLRSERRYAWNDINSMSTPLWDFHIFIKADVDPEFAWQFWTNVANWRELEPGVDFEVDGPFAPRLAGMRESAWTRAAALVDSCGGPPAGLGLKKCHCREPRLWSACDSRKWLRVELE